MTVITHNMLYLMWRRVIGRRMQTSNPLINVKYVLIRIKLCMRYFGTDIGRITNALDYSAEITDSTFSHEHCTFWSRLITKTATIRTLIKSNFVCLFTICLIILNLQAKYMNCMLIYKFHYLLFIIKKAISPTCLYIIAQRRTNYTKALPFVYNEIWRLNKNWSTIVLNQSVRFMVYKSSATWTEHGIALS